MWPGPRPISVPSGILIHLAVWPEYRHRPKIGGGGLCPSFLGEGAGPHLTQCRLGRDLPAYQVASSAIQPFGHNGMCKKWGGLCSLFLGGELAPYLTHVALTEAYLHVKFHLDPSTVWPQYTTSQTDRTGRTSVLGAENRFTDDRPKMKLGIEVGLGPVHVMLDGDPFPPAKEGTHTPIFGPCLFWPNGWMHTTWYRGKPRHRRHCVRWGPSSP